MSGTLKLEVCPSLPCPPPTPLALLLCSPPVPPLPSNFGGGGTARSTPISGGGTCPICPFLYPLLADAVWLEWEMGDDVMKVAVRSSMLSL